MFLLSDIVGSPQSVAETSIYMSTSHVTIVYIQMYIVQPVNSRPLYTETTLGIKTV